MKKTWLTTNELAALLQVSIKTIRRAYRNGEIPIVRFRRMVRFDLEEARRVMQQKSIRPNLRVAPQRATAGMSRRRAQHKAPGR